MPPTPFRIHESLEELEALLRREKNAQRSRRLHMLVLIKGGLVKTLKDAADYLAVHRNTVSRWKALYAAGGLKKLLTVKETGPEPGQRTLPKEVYAALRERLVSAEGFSSYKELQRWLEEAHGSVVKYKTLYRIVRFELGARPGESGNHAQGVERLSKAPSEKDPS